MLLILSDTREQKEISFDGIDGIYAVEKIALPFGDYTAMIGKDKDSLKQIPISFARKGFSDLWGTMSNGENYQRFKKEMGRAKDSGHKLILIIEGSYSDVWNGFERSQFEGPAMLKKLATLYVKYDLEYIFCESRRVMARRIVDTFLAIERNWS